MFALEYQVAFEELVLVVLGLYEFSLFILFFSLKSKTKTKLLIAKLVAFLDVLTLVKIVGDQISRVAK